MTERAPYTLGFTGIQPQYKLDDWKTILDGMAREGINRVYFWWQSQYKPRNFPDRRNIDGGSARIKMTNDDVNELARYAHKLGMTFLLGGGRVFVGWSGLRAHRRLPRNRCQGHERYVPVSTQSTRGATTILAGDARVHPRGRRHLVRTPRRTR